MGNCDSNGGTKVCIACAEAKPLTAFRKQRRKCYRCIESDRVYSPEEMARRAARNRERYHNATPEQKAQRAAKKKEYVERNRDAIQEWKQRYREENRERLSREWRERYASDPEMQERMRTTARAHREANRELRAKQNAAWAAQNKEKMAGYFRASKAKRRQNPAHRLNDSISAQIRIAIGDKKEGRRWERLVGYALSDLVAHLERQFLPGMSWENYGESWHIDHIIARAEFELRDADDAAIRACWALPNLRPLWAEQNMSKGKRRTHLL